MPEVHDGGCLCGAVRYRVRNQPVRALACHCTACQKRTGSAFGIGVTRAIAGGTLDDPKWLKIERHSRMRSAHSWIKPPEGVEVFQKSAIAPPSR